MKTKIYASAITNLSDARNFSAMGVDYAGFVVDDPSIGLQKVKEMVGWIEGPTLVAEFQQIQIDTNNFEPLKEMGFDYFTFSPFCKFESPDFKTIKQLLDTDSLVDGLSILKIETPFGNLSKDEKSKLASFVNTHQVIVDIPFNTSDFELIIHALNPYAIILRGGEEEKTGVKSYEELDSIFELLQD